MAASVIGPGWQDALSQSQYRLRFELGGEMLSNIEQPVERFVQAFDRARAIIGEVFAKSQSEIGVIGFWPLEEDQLFAPPFKPGETGLDCLKRLGFPDFAPISTWRAHPKWVAEEDKNEDSLFDWHAYDLTGRSTVRDILIWGAVACEMPIQPWAPVVAYMFDPDASIEAFVYDDRGMDVTALTAEALLPLYRRYDAWLLDYDRPRMAEAFGPQVLSD